MQPTLLIVDDEPSTLISLKRTLTPEGYNVHTAESALDALKILETLPVDIIISDMRMPQMSGAEFLKEAAERWPDVRRILMTGYDDIHTAIVAINVGQVNYYLAKSSKKEEMLSAINSMLENKLLRDQNRIMQELINQQNEKLKLLNTQLEEKIQKRTAELHRSYGDLQETHEAAIQVFLSIQELNENHNKGYSRKVATHAKLLAKAMHLTEKEIQTVYLAAMLHNLGRNGLREEIRFKPFAQLTTREYQEFKQYPMLGAMSLSAFPSLKEVVNTILYHRERFNGKGYPHGVKGDSIPLFSAILSIAVDYNELMYGLIFQEKYPAKQALAYMKENEERYDRKLLLLFMDIIASLPEQQTALMEKALEPHQLINGMVLSRDLKSSEGFIFLKKGCKLDDELIERITALRHILVYVYDNVIPPAAPQD